MYNKALELLTSAGRFHISLGLERISAVLELLGNPQDKLKCIHAAGTNGKGSVCAMLASVLSEAGLKTGLYTSPHIYDYTERIKINGREISQEDFAGPVFEVCAVADKNNIALTEFEILTAVMFKYFADNKIDAAVLETGLGGRLDAVNVIKSNLCAVITHIDYDHTERLGGTLEEITFEKEGIIKPGCPVIRASETRCSESRMSEFSEFLSLKGCYQRENLSLVLETLELLYPEISDETIKAGLRKVNHPARFQIVNENLIVDACHNPDGARALRESLDFYFPDRARRFVFGCMQNKDYEKMAEVLFRVHDDVYFYEFKNSRKFGGRGQRGKKFQSLAGLPKDETLTVVCGSIYMLSGIIPKEVLLGGIVNRKEGTAKDCHSPP
ncbi:MAG: bifunctional folylpolyglutamate synthase/dihydrofolate synthase [Heliobacteriaceae bacterium]|jgi:dihydrofolate synthase/folylpolyglutamate synthase|nr:bifunctional folylpolyglutamate synthase/dihydrofolate synthase [Heliobacteriaceae bacterium]